MRSSQPMGTAAMSMSMSLAPAWNRPMPGLSQRMRDMPLTSSNTPPAKGTIWP